MSPSIHRSIIVALCLLLNMTIIVSKTNGQAIPIEDADSLMQREPKPIIILLTTDWCTYCAMQQKQIKKSKLNNQDIHNFYFIHINPEAALPIIFNRKKYEFNYSGYQVGIHEFAKFLVGKDKISYPSWIIIDQNYNVLQRYQGVLKSKELDTLINSVEKMHTKNQK